MGQTTGISWTDHTANFWMGCVKVSALCDNCYAERDSLRYGNDIFGADKRRIFPKSVWSNVRAWNKQAGKDGVRRRCFVMSFGDFFEQLHKDHPDLNQMKDARNDAYILMEDCTNLEFLVLTKRISNVRKMVPIRWLQEEWPDNIRLGISVGTQKDADRDIPRLLRINCPNFLSMEPLLERVTLDKTVNLKTPGDLGVPYYINMLHGIDWVITGGESGKDSRPTHSSWIRLLKDQCINTNTPFHLKQWGEWLPEDQVSLNDPIIVRSIHKWPDGSKSLWVGKKAAGHLLDGKEWLEFPR